MKKILSFLLAIFLVNSCSTNSDGTKDTVPLPPTNLTGNVISTTQINLSWTDNSTNETGFKIERRTGLGTYAIVGTVNSDILTFSETSLTPSATYTYRVYSYNAVGNSPTYSNEFTLTANILPTLNSTTVSAITNITASSGGNVITDGGATVTARGIVWGTTTNPTIALTTKTIDGTGIGAFTSALSGLIASTTYYVRAYATNQLGTAYGNEVTFKTGVVPATLTTEPVTNITFTSALTGGNVTTSGGNPITESGVVWSATPNPTIALTTKLRNSTVFNKFTIAISGLTDSTTYYVRAYATNSTGTYYGNEISFTTLSLSTAATDIDGNVYPTVTICSQTWTKTNLNVTKYRNGDVIPQVTDPTKWVSLTTGAWCYYANTSSNGTTYGKLYNWYAVIDPRGLAPVGYHIPTDTEWTTLTTCLGGEIAAGGKMKETGTTHWTTPNTDATNSSGFTGLAGGIRQLDGPFYGIGISGWWWSSSVGYSPSRAKSRNLHYLNGIVYNDNPYKISGFSVRCLKD